MDQFHFGRSYRCRDCVILPKDWSFGNRVATNPFNTRRNEGETDVHQYGTATDLNIPVNDEWRGLAEGFQTLGTICQDVPAQEIFQVMQRDIRLG